MKSILWYLLAALGESGSNLGESGSNRTIVDGESGSNRN